MAACGGCPRSTYRLYCKREGNGKDYCVTVRDGKLCLTLPNNCDPCQLWQKDESNKCEFMLVHSATDKSVRIGCQGDQLVLVNKPVCPDKTTMWVESGDIKLGYTYIRTLSNLGMVMDAWTGNIFDGTKISIGPENKNVNGEPRANADNQLWKFVLACKSYPHLINYSEIIN